MIRKQAILLFINAADPLIAESKFEPPRGRGVEERVPSRRLVNIGEGIVDLETLREWVDELVDLSDEQATEWRESGVDPLPK